MKVSVPLRGNGLATEISSMKFNSLLLKFQSPCGEMVLRQRRLESRLGKACWTKIDAGLF